MSSHALSSAYRPSYRAQLTSKHTYLFRRRGSCAALRPEVRKLMLDCRIPAPPHQTFSLSHANQQAQSHTETPACSLNIVSSIRQDNTWTGRLDTLFSRFFVYQTCFMAAQSAARHAQPHTIPRRPTRTLLRMAIAQCLTLALGPEQLGAHWRRAQRAHFSDDRRCP